jgi:hypothetical protein
VVVVVHGLVIFTSYKLESLDTPRISGGLVGPPAVALNSSIALKEL